MGLTPGILVGRADVVRVLCCDETPGEKTVLPAVIVTVTGKNRVYRKKKIRQILPGVECSEHIVFRTCR